MKNSPAPRVAQELCKLSLCWFSYYTLRLITEHSTFKITRQRLFYSISYQIGITLTKWDVLYIPTIVTEIAGGDF